MTPDLIQSLFAKHNLPVPVAEYQFHPERRWRFDWAWPEHKIAVEIEGGIWTGGRHTSPKGFFADMEKKNAAAVLGWRILYITPKAAGTLIMLQLVKDCIQPRP
jgi:hypothetical protein